MGRTGDLVNGPKGMETQPALLTGSPVAYMYGGCKCPGKEGLSK